jgi:hypothetical protein
MAAIIQYTRNALKGKEYLSQDEKNILEALEQDLRETAGKPLGRGWRSLGPVRQYAPNAYHCHLTRNKVALWLIFEDGKGEAKVVLCRFEYVGQRGRAPY